LWFALSATTLGTIDAAEWAPSTASKADMALLDWDVCFTPVNSTDQRNTF
jgi:hypothetical protein